MTLLVVMVYGGKVLVVGLAYMEPARLEMPASLKSPTQPAREMPSAQTKQG